MSGAMTSTHVSKDAKYRIRKRVQRSLQQHLQLCVDPECSHTVTADDIIKATVQQKRNNAARVHNPAVFDDRDGGDVDDGTQPDDIGGDEEPPSGIEGTSSLSAVGSPVIDAGDVNRGEVPMFPTINHDEGRRDQQQPHDEEDGGDSRRGPSPCDTEYVQNPQQQEQNREDLSEDDSNSSADEESVGDKLGSVGGAFYDNAVPFAGEGQRPSIRDVFLTTLALAVRHKWSRRSTLDSFELSNKTLGLGDVFPNTPRKLQSVLGKISPAWKTHVYCDRCSKIIPAARVTPGKKVTCECGSFTSFKRRKLFLTASVKAQVRRILQLHGIEDLLQYRDTRRKFHDDAIQDIYDGSEYKRLREPGGPLSGKWDISLTFSTDGCETSTSSRVSAWPIYAIINELPPALRSRHMMLVAIWVDKSEPNMNVFFRQFVRDVDRLARRGVTWKLRDGTTIRSRVVPVVCVTDIMARFPLMNMVSFHSSEFGCTSCFASGEYHCGAMRYSADCGTGRRSAADIIKHMSLATQKGVIVCGHKGASVVINLHGLPLGTFLSVDDLHPLYIGVAQAHLKLLLETCPVNPTSKEDKVKRHIANIDKTLLKFETPSSIARKPRSLSLIGLWKASEWRNWLLYYSLPCLKGFVQDKYLQHLSLLVEAAYVLACDAMLPESLERCERLIRRFTVTYEHFFGLENMTYNLHQLSHMVEDVKHWGPLYTHSTFLFETWNMRLLNFISKPVRAVWQVADKFLMYQLLQHAVHMPEISAHARMCASSVFTPPKPSSIHCVKGVQFMKEVGKGEPSEAELAALREAGIEIPHPGICITRFRKVWVDNTAYCIQNLGESSNDTTVYTSDAEMLQIQSIVVVSSDAQLFEEEAVKITGVFGVLYDIAEESPCFNATHITKRTLSACAPLKFYSTDDMWCPCVRVREVQNRNWYVAPVCSVTSTE